MREVVRAGNRYLTEAGGVTTRHSFSYGRHYDPDNVGFGPILAVNTEHVEAGRGYDEHHHADVEIVTWVVQGSLRHEDETGHRGTLRPGTVQRVSAGTGMRHTERNASTDDPVVFVQMMLSSDHSGEPEYALADLDLVPGVVTSTIDVHAPAELVVLRLTGGQSAELPAAPRRLIHVATGSVLLGDTVLNCGDEARLTGDAAYALSATAAPGGVADVLIWLLRS